MSYIGKITAGGSTYKVGSTLYGTCDTPADTAAKVAVVEGFDTLIEGVTVHIQFTASNTASNPTLAIKPSSSGTATTAKYIWIATSTSPGTTAQTSWFPGAVVSLTYDGTGWVMNDYVYNTDTNDAVTQTATTTDADYEVLFSGTADNTTRTEGARKTQYLKYNPSTYQLQISNPSSSSGSTTYFTDSYILGQYIINEKQYIYTGGSGYLNQSTMGDGQGFTCARQYRSSRTGSWSTQLNTQIKEEGLIGKYNTTEKVKIIVPDGGSSSSSGSLLLTNGQSSPISLTANNTDITLAGTSNTWDGTNTSLKTAVTGAKGTVTQTESTTDAEYEVTFAGSTGTTTKTEGVGKSEYFKFNPSKKALTFGNRVYASTVGDYSVAEGINIIASGSYSHGEGSTTTASGSYSHSEGYGTYADGKYSHAEGNTTTANHKSQHTFGEYNIADPSTAAATARGNYVEIVGNGTADNARSNARTLDWSGNEVLAGQLTDKYGLQSTRALTQAQYNALSTTEKNNGTCYYITDAESVEDTLLWSKVGTGTIGTGDTNLTSAVNTLNDRTKGIKQVVAGTKVVATTAKNYQQIFTNAEINSLLGVTGSSNGNIVVLVENGDYSAQPKYLGSVVYENGNYFVKPIDNSNFTTGNLRVNYVVIRFA